MIERTVIGWDGTEGANDAVEWALKRPSTEEIVLVCVDNDVAFEQTFAANTAEVSARAGLTDEADRIRSEDRDRSVRTELVQGEIGASLAAFSSPSSLVVTGTRRPGVHARRSWSVGARVAGHAAGPVAVIPRGAATERSTIVVGVDEPEQPALLFAAEEALRVGSTLRPVRAWLPGPLWPGQTEHDPAYLDELATMYSEAMTDALEPVLLHYPDLLIEPLIVQGEPADVLLESADDAGMLVVGNRGLRGLKRFFLGSVSHAVVLSSRVPTVVVNQTS